MLRDPCESASISKVFFPLSESAWPRTIDVTVLPTPPRWFATTSFIGIPAPHWRRHGGWCDWVVRTGKRGGPAQMRLAGKRNLSRILDHRYAVSMPYASRLYAL